MRPSPAERTTVEHADTPPSRAGLQAALQVADGLRELFEQGPAFLDRVEATFGLRLGQLRALRAIGDATTTTERIARLTGEHPAATTATLASLNDAGLVTLHGDDRVALTEAGRARRDQLVALSLRLSAHVADEADERHNAPADAIVHRLRTPTDTVVFPHHRPVA